MKKKVKGKKDQPPKGVIWNVKITTSVKNTMGYTEDDVKLFNEVAYDPRVSALMNEIKDKTLSGVKQYPVAIWQVEKGREIWKTFKENITWTVTPETVSLKAEYKIGLPEWEMGFLIEWNEGFNLLYKDYLMGTMEDYPKKHPDHYKRTLELFKRDLLWHQHYEITRG